MDSCLVDDGGVEQPRREGAHGSAGPGDLARQSWGPEATRARAVGAIPPIALTPLMTQWDAWGKTVLRDGDILFRRGDARILLGRFPFSRFLAAASNSRFSHTGIVGHRGRRAGRLRHHQGRGAAAAVPRLDPRQRRPVRRQAGPARGSAVCRQGRPLLPRPGSRSRSPFDFDLDIDDEAFYCVEMTEKAYRSSGMPLSEPVRLGDMENITRYPICVFVFLKLSNLTLEQPVYFPGNERHGIWSCPRLMTVYESKPTPEEQKGWFSRIPPLGWPTAGVRTGTRVDLDSKDDSGKLAHLRPFQRNGWGPDARFWSLLTCSAARDRPPRTGSRGIDCPVGQRRRPRE